MNRRDFIKIAGAFGLAALLPIKIGDDMELGQLWKKVALNQRLNSEELQFLELEGRNTQLRNAFVAGNTTPDNLLKNIADFQIIFSEILQEDKSSLDVKIPSDYKHLMIMGSGRCSETGGGAEYILARFNYDTGNNYDQQKSRMFSTTVDASISSNQTGALIGQLRDTDAAAGSAANFFSIIPHCKSGLHKTVLSLTMAGYQWINFNGTIWENTAPIQTLTFLSAGGFNILAGSVISVYGLR